MTPLLLLLAACSYDEGILVQNLRGTVVIPGEAAQGVVLDAAGQEVVETDVRFIGPVYLGLYPSIRENLLEYPHPEVGPVFQSGVPGDTYPYGGTTVGDFRYACFEFFACRVVSGRYVDFDDLLGWFDDSLGMPVPDAAGNPVTTGDYIRQTCYQQLNYTSDAELRITATDENADGAVDLKDLDFVQNEDGDFEGAFTVWQQDWLEADESGEGFSLWGWMDSPSDEGFRFSSCDPSNGYNRTEYNEDFFGGQQYLELLNQPSQYIGPGDWVSGRDAEGAQLWHIYEAPDDEVRVVMGQEVVQ